MAKVDKAPPGPDLSETAAGVSSVKQSLSQEPSFTRKKKAGGGEREGQIVREGILKQDREEPRTSNEVNRALSFKAGDKCSQSAPSPSEYQVQFTWKSGRQPEGPLLRAERLRLNGGAWNEREGGKKGGSEEEGVPNPQSNGHQSPRQNKEQLKTKGGAVVTKSQPEKRKGRSNSKSPAPSSTETKRPSRSQAGHRPNKPKSKRTSTGQSEYRTQFKAWPIPSRAGRGPSATRWKRVQSPKKRSDITDPEMVTQSPAPAPLPGPLKTSIWGTEYSTRFRSPLDFQYICGAWKESPHHSSSPRRREPNSKLAGKANGITAESEGEEEREEMAENGEEEEGEGEGELPIPPQESLLAQVTEIRSKASQYRQRSEGCHFLPAHSSWQPAGSEREGTLIEAHPHSPSGRPPSGVSSLSSEEEPVKESSVPPRTLANGGGLDVVDIEEDEDEEEVRDTSSDESEDEDRRVVHRSSVADNPEPKSLRAAAATKRVSPPHPDGELGGRVPTPILKQSPQNILRHHLDRTTPSSGAVLTSPSLLAPARSLANDSRRGHGGERAGKSSLKRDGARKIQSARWSSGHTGGEVEISRADGGKKGLHLSQASARLKRDPSLISSAPHSTFHSHTLPKSSMAQHSRFAPSSSQPQTSHRTHHTLTNPPPHPSPPPSTISSLLSSIRSSSSNGPAKRLDYGNSTGGRRFAGSSARRLPQSRPFNTHSSRMCGGCTSDQCDICGAWLRNKTPHTGAQASNSSSNPRPQTAVPLGQPGTRSYRGPVTQLSEKLNTRSVSSRSGVPATFEGTRSNYPQSNGVPRSNSHRDPPGVGVPPQTNPRPLKEADELSISSLSLSSCSVASDLLRKARERREKFWT